MPLTPLHYPVAFFMYKCNKKLVLPALTVGSMFPDLEIPVLILLFGTRIPERLVLHSLLGAATVGTMLSIVLTVSVYPHLLRLFLRIEETKMKCRLSRNLVLSSFLGNISHVLLDIVNHSFNPLFWPFQSSTPSPICLALGGTQNASLFAHAALTVLFVIILVTQKENLWRKLTLGE